MLPPRSLICAVTTASPIQIKAKTPEKTMVFCSDEAVMESKRLSNKQKMSGPLNKDQSQKKFRAANFVERHSYQRSQSRRPSLMPPCKTTSASGQRPAMPRKPPARLSPSPRSAPPNPPPLCKNPPSKYLGHNTWRIFSQTASRSRESVSHTDSSIVLLGARRSSPGSVELRYDCGRGLRDEF